VSQLITDKKNKVFSEGEITYLHYKNMYSLHQEYSHSDLLEGEEVVHLCTFLPLWSLVAYHSYPIGSGNCAPLLLPWFSDKTLRLCHPSLGVFFGIIHGPIKAHRLQLHMLTN